MQITCHCCSTTWKLDPPISRREACPSCSQDARVCLNCRFYDVGYSDECREISAESVVNKELGNFCEYFLPSENKGSLSRPTCSDAARQSLERLFVPKTD